MIISDLEILEVVNEGDTVEGGVGNFFSTQSNYSSIGQYASASSGNSYWGWGGIAIGNVAVAGNVAAPVQVNA
jgi:hypothetical protein